MNASDRDEFAELLAFLGEAFNEPISDARGAAYWLALRDLPLVAVRAAVEDVLRSCRFFPKPVELREPAQRSIMAAALAIEQEAVQRQRLLEAPAELARALTDAAATARRQEAEHAEAARRQAEADAAEARWAALSPEEQAAETAARAAAAKAEQEARDAALAAEAAAERERRWAWRDAHRRRTPVTRSDDRTVQRCPKCNSFRIIPNPTGELWQCARCGTFCDA